MGIVVLTMKASVIEMFLGKYFYMCIWIGPKKSCQEKHINSIEYLFMINLLERSQSENAKCRSNSGCMCKYSFMYSKYIRYIAVSLCTAYTHIHKYLCMYSSATNKYFSESIFTDSEHRGAFIA